MTERSVRARLSSLKSVPQPVIKLNGKLYSRNAYSRELGRATRMAGGGDSTTIGRKGWSEGDPPVCAKKRDRGPKAHWSFTKNLTQIKWTRQK